MEDQVIRIHAPILPILEDRTIRVVMLTPDLKKEMRRWHLQYRIWRGYIIVDLGYSYRGTDYRGQVSSRTDYRGQVSSRTTHEGLRYLLSYDYEFAIRDLQEANRD